MIKWISSVRNHFAKRLGALVGVPFAQPYEAPNSWFMRAAALQGCSHKEFASYLGFNFGHDFDNQYYRVFSKEPPASPEVQSFTSGSIFYAKGYPIGNSMYGRGHRGRYRFCPLCLKDLQIPCIHLYSRIQEFVFCPWHRCLLEDKCTHCQSPVELSRDMMEPVKRKPGVEDLSWCLICQQPLHTVRPIFIDSQFLWAMPYWLREWGKDGPTAIGGEGPDEFTLSLQRARLLYISKKISCSARACQYSVRLIDFD